MFHSSIIPVGLPVSTVLGVMLALALNSTGMAAAEVLVWAKTVTALSNLLAGGAKNLAMLDYASLLVMRPISLFISLTAVAGVVGVATAA